MRREVIIRLKYLLETKTLCNFVCVNNVKYCEI